VKWLALILALIFGGSAFAQLPPATLTTRTNRAPAMTTLTSAFGTPQWGAGGVLAAGEYWRLAIGTNTPGRYQYFTNTIATNAPMRVPKLNAYNLAVADVIVISNRFGKALKPPITNIAWSKEIIYRLTNGIVTVVKLGAPTAAASAQTNFTFTSASDFPQLFTRLALTPTNGGWSGRLQDTISLESSKWSDRIAANLFASSNIVLTAMIQNAPTPTKGAAALVTPNTFTPTNYVKLYSVSVSGWAQSETPTATVTPLLTVPIL
jgi:hypothetical protein